MSGNKRKERNKSGRKARMFERNEGQLADGRYYYKYPKGMKDGKTVFGRIYSWTLTPTDKWPSDKRPGKNGTKSLRELEAELALLPHPRTSTASIYLNMTIYELFERYVSIYCNDFRTSTKTGYGTTLNWLREDPFGKRKIMEVLPSEANEWLQSLRDNQGKNYSTLNHFHSHLKLAYEMAIDDHVPIQGNPFAFKMAKVIKKSKKTREAITKEQMERFLQMMKEDNYFNRYYDAVYVLFHTGLRISEFCGLQVSDIDFEKKTIQVERQLLRNTESVIYIEFVKTESGNRTIPISDETCQCLQNMIRNRKKPSKPAVYDGYSDFLYYDKDGKPGIAMTWQHYFQHMREKFSEKYPEEVVPHVSPHVCRHTFCTNLINAGVSISVVKYVMGHSDFDITLNTYTHAHDTDAEKELRGLYNQGVYL